MQLAAQSDKDLLAIGNLGNVSLREIRSKLKANGWGLTDLTNAICAVHCKSLAELIDPDVAAHMHILEFEISPLFDRGFAQCLLAPPNDCADRTIPAYLS